MVAVLFRLSNVVFVFAWFCFAFVFWCVVCGVFGVVCFFCVRLCVLFFVLFCVRACVMLLVVFICWRRVAADVLRMMFLFFVA